MKVKLNHIGLNIQNKSDLVDFYENILEFRPEYQFELKADFALKIFGINKQTEIFYYKKGDLNLELFVHSGNTTLGFSHLCVEVTDREIIAKKAETAGYPITRIERIDKADILFIRDKAGNIFELKNIG